MKRPDAITSARMGGVRQKGTRIELAVGDALRLLGARYRKNVKSLPGSPDFANRSRRWAVFVNGCFWHHHKGCRRATIPKSNRAFWLTKFRDNRQRDARAIVALRRRGFRVAMIWECEVQAIPTKLSKILEAGRVDT